MGIIVLDNKTKSSTQFEYGDYLISKPFLRVVPMEEKIWIHGKSNSNVIGYKKIDVVKENINEVLSL